MGGSALDQTEKGIGACAYQVAVGALEVEHLDGDDLVEWLAERAVHDGAAALPDLLVELVVLHVDRVPAPLRSRASRRRLITGPPHAADSVRTAESHRRSDADDGRRRSRSSGLWVCSYRRGGGVSLGGRRRTVVPLLSHRHHASRWNWWCMPWWGEAIEEVGREEERWCGGL